MVDPLLEIPGKIANACDKPITILFRKVISSFFFGIYLESNKIVPVIPNIIITRSTLENEDSSFDFKDNPIMPAGIVAIIM